MVPRQGDAGDRLQSADTRNTGRARLGRIPRGQAPPLPREAVRCAHALAGAVGLGRVVRTVPARQFSAAFPIFLSHHPLPETRGAQPVLGRRGELPRNLIDLCKDATIMKHIWGKVLGVLQIPRFSSVSQQLTSALISESCLR